MTSISKRLLYILVLTIIMFIVAIFVLNKKLKDSYSGNNSQEKTQPSLTPTPTPLATVTGSDKKKVVTTTPTATNKPTENTNSNTTNSNTNNNSSTPTATSQPTASPTVVPVVTTPEPTQQPETVNIQVWVKGWGYTESGSQYSVDGDVKIYNGSTLVASGFYNSYEEPYKASNLPTNANLSIYFYMGTCGQIKYISTGSSSSLQQLDFNFYPSTNCLQ